MADDKGRPKEDARTVKKSPSEVLPSAEASKFLKESFFAALEELIERAAILWKIVLDAVMTVVACCIWNWSNSRLEGYKTDVIDDAVLTTLRICYAALLFVPILVKFKKDISKFIKK